jgi:hypothetical protein
MNVMSKKVNEIHIDRALGPRRTKTAEMPLDKLRLDPQNVRFKHHDKLMRDVEMEDLIWQESDTKELYRAILASGGLSEKPLVTLDGVVKEGNRRVVCLRKAKVDLKSGKINDLPVHTFDKVDVEVFDEHITPAEVDLLLARIHVSGKKQWAALNQANHLYGLYHDRGYSYEQIREYLGVGKAEVMRKIQAFKATRDYMQATKSKNITDYSFFEELYKKRELASIFDGDPGFRDNIYKWIREGKFDFTFSRDMRQLPEVLKDPELKAAFEKKGMAAAQFEAQKKNPALASPVFKAVESALTSLREMPRDVVRGLADNNRQVELLKNLRDEIAQVFKDANVKV